MWVLAVNDGEAVEIVRLLHEYGEPVMLSREPWGASWAGLEAGIQDALRRFRAANPTGEIVGVELSGANPYGAGDIDHHRYDNDDRNHTLEDGAESPSQHIAPNLQGQIEMRLGLKLEQQTSNAQWRRCVKRPGQLDTGILP